MEENVYQFNLKLLANLKDNLLRQKDVIMSLKALAIPKMEIIKSMGMNMVEVEEIVSNQDRLKDIDSLCETIEKYLQLSSGYSLGLLERQQQLIDALVLVQNQTINNTLQLVKVNEDLNNILNNGDLEQSL